MHGVMAIVVAAGVAVGLGGAGFDRKGVGGQEATSGRPVGCEPAQPVPFEIVWPAPEPTPPYIEVRPPITVDWDPSAWQEEMRRQKLMERLTAQILNQAAARDAFAPTEADGLVAQLSQISASVSLSQQRFGVPGCSVQRSISLSGSLCDLSGSRSFRIVGAPRVVELTDEDGESLLGQGTWYAYPDNGNPQPFTRPSESPGSMQQQSFSLGCNDLGRLPSVIGVLRLEMDVAVAGEGAEFLLRAQPTEEFVELAPGVEARVSTVRTEGGQTGVGVEYRLVSGAEPGQRAWFLRAEALDDEMRVLQIVDHAQEAQMRTGTVGAVAIWGIDSREAPVWWVRLRFVPSGQTTRIEIVERDLPLMGG